MVYATGPYDTKHAEAGYAHYTTTTTTSNSSNLLSSPGKKSEVFMISLDHCSNVQRASLLAINIISL